MRPADHLAALARLYGMDANTLRRSLPDIADGIHAQMGAIYVAPSVSGCEALAANLEGVRRYVLRLAEAIRMEVPHGDE